MYSVHEAARDNDVEQLTELAQSGMPLDAINGTLRKTALHMAARHGSTEAIQFLLQHGIPADCKDLLGRTPLHYAIDNHHTNAIKALLYPRGSVKIVGAFVLAEDNERITPLHFAVRANDPDILSLMLDRFGQLSVETARKFLQVPEAHQKLRVFPACLELYRHIRKENEAWKQQSTETTHPMYFARSILRNCFCTVNAAQAVSRKLPDLADVRPCKAYKDNANLASLCGLAQNGLVNVLNEVEFADDPSEVDFEAAGVQGLLLLSGAILVSTWRFIHTHVGDLLNSGKARNDDMNVFVNMLMDHTSATLSAEVIILKHGLESQKLSQTILGSRARFLDIRRTLRVAQYLFLQMMIPVCLSFSEVDDDPWDRDSIL